MNLSINSRRFHQGAALSRYKRSRGKGDTKWVRHDQSGIEKQVGHFADAANVLFPIGVGNQGPCRAVGDVVPSSTICCGVTGRESLLKAIRA